jgi:hypothetical protein
MKNNNSGSENLGNVTNVIDMTERMQEPDQKARLKSLKVRFDLEQAKVGLSASLLSIVFLVTIANNNILKSATMVETSNHRGIASVPTGTSDAEDTFVRALAHRELSEKSVLGKKPSALESLAFGVLEGRYSIRLENGKLHDLAFSQEKDGSPKLVADLARFIDSNRSLMPVQFDKSVRISRTDMNGEISETYQLVNSVSRPVANVQFELDQDGRLLTMKVSHLQLAANEFSDSSGQ